VESFEEPYEREDEQDYRENFEPLVGEHARDAVGRTDVYLCRVGCEGDGQRPVVRCCFDRGAHGGFELLHVPSVKDLHKSQSVNGSFWERLNTK